MPVFAQVRGSLETFENEGNALSWIVYDYEDGLDYTPGWDLFGAGDADAFTIVAPESGVSILAVQSTSGGDLVGNFSGERIVGMGCEAWVEDASGLEYAEFYFVSGGVFYYSVEFSGEAVFDSGVWDYISVDFDFDPWYVLGDGGFEEVTMTNAILSSVTEVGVNFFTNNQRTENMLVAIDDFFVTPEVIVPELTVARDGSDFEISFMREVSQEYNVMKSVSLSGWSGLTGHLEITGDTIYTVSDPIAEKGFYQVETDYFFTAIPDVD